MNQITVYKDGRSMVINDAEGALKAIRASGWSDKKPRGFKELEVPTEESIESLKEEVSVLTATLEGKATEILELIAKIEELRQGGDSGKGDSD